MSKYDTQRQETAGVIRYSCGAMFAAFVFCYLYFIQGETLAQAQFVFSRGITRYSIFAGATIITLVLLLLQWVVKLLSPLPPRFYAISFIPSAIALLALVDNAESGNQTPLAPWAWIAPISIVSYIIICYAVCKIDFLIHTDEEELTTQMYPNYIILLLIALAIGSFTPTRDVTYYELKTERLLMEGRCKEACEVGTKALATSQRLTQLRMLALSRQGLLAERMMDYPQRYGSDGLLCLADTDSTHRVNAIDVERHLRTICGEGIGTTRRYLQLIANRDSLRSPAVADYYLCGLLLDKRTGDFLADLPRFYNLSDTILGACDLLPRAYREALLMMSDEEHGMQGGVFVNGDSLGTFSDTTFVARYRDYKAMKVGISDERERVNKTHRQFGDTYWWYFDFSDKANGQLMRK